MKIIIETTSKEIADLIVELQGQQIDAEEFIQGFVGKALKRASRSDTTIDDTDANA